MEDDEDIQSQPSPGSGSPAPPGPNGRITVTMAAAAASAAAAPTPQKTLTLALPIQQPRNTGHGHGHGGGGREDCWSEAATAVLIEAWGERYVELSRGNLKQNHWKEVSDIVNSGEDRTKTPKTDVQCKNRIDTVKKKYKSEKAKIVAGGGPSNWRFFDRLDGLIGPTAKIAGNHKSPNPIRVTARQKNKRSRKRANRSSSESEPTPSPSPSADTSTDSLPPPVTLDRKRPRVYREVKSNWGNSVREMTRAILKFGEAYERAERSKIEQMVEMEKKRMKFAKEIELQRMQFFMKTQLEISQLKHRRRVGISKHNLSSNNNNNNNTSVSNDHNSESSS